MPHLLCHICEFAIPESQAESDDDGSVYCPACNETFTPTYDEKSFEETIDELNSGTPWEY